ncbi:class I SAM-dependent methyltransferase [Aquihabitans sp. McL0605]|uniref:class I SAM-dependent methyltransferase n=1 Tax=Aquihabitans sp. McL0605 TaxID=3415671 RepID=UPI003CEEABCD
MRSTERIEVTDLVLDIGPDGVRRPVDAGAVIQACLDHGDRRAARIARSLPTTDGVLDPDRVDHLLVAVHGEIQRLAEEFHHGARVWAIVGPMLDALRAAGVPPPYRVVDVGCGTGYVVRWLAANARAPDVSFAGVDLNPALIAAARGAALEEHLDCDFHASDVFALDLPATVLISTGVLHHFRSAALERFFRLHEEGTAQGFVHIDFEPSPIAGLGAWLFHHTRMRLPLSRHDGVRSAQRAYPAELLVEVTATQAPSFATWVSDRTVRGTPFPCALTNLVGTRRSLGPDAMTAVGHRPRHGRGRR